MQIKAAVPSNIAKKPAAPVQQKKVEQAPKAIEKKVTEVTESVPVSNKSPLEEIKTEKAKEMFLDNIVADSLTPSLYGVTYKKNKKKLNSYEQQLEKENEMWSNLDASSIEHIMSEQLGDIPEPEQKS